VDSGKKLELARPDRFLRTSQLIEDGLVKPVRSIKEFSGIALNHDTMMFI
jgi:hypothetical protein